MLHKLSGHIQASNVNPLIHENSVSFPTTATNESSLIQWACAHRY